MSSGEEWKGRRGTVSMTAYYSVQRYLADAIEDSSRPVASWESVVEEFRPKGRSSRAWFRECIDELIAGWTASSDEIMLALHGVKCSLRERYRVAYRCGLDHAMNAGSWPRHYWHMAKELMLEEEESTDDCA